MFSRRCLSQRIDENETLGKVAAWECDPNEKETGVDWQFNASDARIKVKLLYRQIKH